MRADSATTELTEPQQHPGESTAAVAADNRQLRILRLNEKLMRGLVE
jgi:hypothetical protein